MNTTQQNLDKLIDTLEERVKELNCLYEVEELLHKPDISSEEIFTELVKIIPPAMQYPEACAVKIEYGDRTYTSDNYQDSPWALNSDLRVNNRTVGNIRVCYCEEKPELEVGPFLVDEKELIDSISQRVSNFIMYQKLKQVFNRWASTKEGMSGQKPGEWKVVLELIRRTDLDLYGRISRKMLNHLVWKGVEESEELLQEFAPSSTYDFDEVSGESNIPLEKRTLTTSNALIQKVYEIAVRHLSNEELLGLIQKWMQQDKTAFLVRAVSTKNTSINEIADAIRRYYQLTPEGMELTPSSLLGVRAGLIRRIFSDQLEFINIAKNYIRVTDFRDLLPRVIYPANSHGKLGGKSAGVILAHRILRKAAENNELLQDIKIPKSWFITSDVMIYFMHFNNLEEILEQKYKDISEVRKEYPHVVLLFKNSHFPPDIVQGLSMALDDFGEVPLVVRSSSLLEDRLGSAFAGKYKSLFIANQGSKSDRLNALLDAIAEVYASTVGPDPIGYRAERGLLDFHEEMGIIIQEVVGQRVGNYYLPSFAGVAFSNNEFRWSPRIKKEDGLIRLVPGLGTRAVDRLSDDYPILIAPGQPGLRANVSVDEIVRYSPQKVDVVNLKANRFETIELRQLLREFGNEYPGIEKLASVFEHGHLKPPTFNTDFAEDDIIITADGLIRNSRFVEQMRHILKELQKAMATPVDIEFASDGNDFYLLQCRPQSYSKYDAPAEIPKNIPAERILFTAERYVTNGQLRNINFIVYVDPDGYAALSSRDELLAVGKLIGQLNKTLPPREFILMGPGRWGSRGDIKLGVSVTYSEINNTAMLIEIARKKGNYVPDLSFGTHFFQDLVEANIRYLPLYPDEKGIVFNEKFLTKSPNALYEILPAFSHLSNVVHVIDVKQAANGMQLNVLMNADEDKAVALFAPPGSIASTDQEFKLQVESTGAEHARWRLRFAEKIAEQLDPTRLGVKALYLLGSTHDATAQAGSDIDLLVLFEGNEQQKRDLQNWLEGWSRCLDEINYLRTGFKAGGLLDVHLVDAKDIKNKEDIFSKFDLIDKSGIRELPLHQPEKTKK
ncbi:MAG TPA: pyruvate, phosphate dikinase [Caldithrix abyssi]|uniref:Phosphoenolpyruvate synthase n=1 Tax=Caldithrix abyssi TaxID=187145 RepID=A0A7V4WWD0_CALAY|nr:pyruvate, phosphate dikinase [Caldithrix abyssi]